MRSLSTSSVSSFSSFCSLTVHSYQSPHSNISNFYTQTLSIEIWLKPFFLGWWFWNIFGKELIRGIVVTDIPEVLRHGNDEGTNNQDSEKGGVFSWTKQKNVDCFIWSFNCVVRSRREVIVAVSSGGYIDQSVDQRKFPSINDTFWWKTQNEASWCLRSFDKDVAKEPRPGATVWFPKKLNWQGGTTAHKSTQC